MAVIQERKDGKGRIKYTAIIRLKGHPTECATFERKTDAKLWIQQTEAAIREGRYFKTAEAKKHTLGELIDRYIEKVAVHRKDANKVTAHLKWWKNHLGKYLLSDISPALLAEYRDILLSEPSAKGTKKAPGTVNRYIASLSIALSTAVRDWGWIEDNPMSKVRKPREPRGRVRFLSEEEHKRLVDACQRSKSPNLYPVVILALSTGARFSEILSLKWKDFDLNRGMIILEETKNGERRSIPLTGHAFDMLQRMNKIRQINTSFVFPSKDGTKPADIRDGWDLALEVAEITDFRFHDLRHTAASYLAMNGATTVEIATILGHKTLSMVKRYAHLTEQHTAKILERMNTKQFGNIYVEKSY